MFVNKTELSTHSHDIGKLAQLYSVKDAAILLIEKRKFISDVEECLLSGSRRTCCY